MRAVAVRGRWVWRLSGIATIAGLGIPLGHLITSAGQGGGGQVNMMAVPSQMITIAQPVTSLSVESYGAPINIAAGPVRHVEVTESITYGPADGGPPDVISSVSGGHLTLASPDCGQTNCSIGFTITVPGDVAVAVESDGGNVDVAGVAAANIDSGGGPVRATGVTGQLTIGTENGSIMVSGIAGANLDSGGGPVFASNVSGPLTVNTEGGNLNLNGLSGPLDADTGGAPLLASNVAAVTATVSSQNGNVNMAFTKAPQMVSVDTGGGEARLWFSAPPKSVTVSTEGGNAFLTVPGGPYAMNADNGGPGGGPEFIGVPTDPAAPRSITVTTGGGSVRISP